MENYKQCQYFLLTKKPRNLAFYFFYLQKTGDTVSGKQLNACKRLQKHGNEKLRVLKVLPFFRIAHYKTKITHFALGLVKIAHLFL